MGSSLRRCLSMFVKGHFVLLSGQCGNQIGAKVICFSISFFSCTDVLFQNKLVSKCRKQCESERESVLARVRE